MPKNLKPRNSQFILINYSLTKYPSFCFNKCVIYIGHPVLKSTPVISRATLATLNSDKKMIHRPLI